MEVARVILYLALTLVFLPVLILPVIIGSIVAASASGLFQVIRDRLRRSVRRRIAALQTKAVRTAEEPVRGRVRTAEELLRGRVT